MEVTRVAQSPAGSSANQEQQQPPSPELISQKFDLAIALTLNLWPALTVAVTEQWGGTDSSSKRDWLAGVISELFTSRPDTDEEDIEDVLLQVMGDEFECQLEDGSEADIASEICRLKRVCVMGRFEEVERLYARWQEREKRGGDRAAAGLQIIRRTGAEDGDDEDEDDEDDEDEDDDMEDEGGVNLDEDAEMEDAPALVPRKPKPEPEIDEEGFTKVVGKKRR